MLAPAQSPAFNRTSVELKHMRDVITPKTWAPE